MKTATTPRESAKVINFPKPRRATKKPATPRVSAKSIPRVDQAALQSGIYWTAQNTEGISEAAARRYGLTAQPHEIPHDGIGKFACSSPKALLEAMRAFSDWKPSCFDNSHQKICRVEILPDGFIFTAFNTFEEACEAHQRDQA